MVFLKLVRLAKQTAVQTLGLRAGIVGINFGIMIGLAALLGLEAFGALALFWGMSLMAGTILSLGGPLILLRALTDGGGLRFADILRLCIIWPALIALALWGGLTLWMPSYPWVAILCTGLAINLISCLASIMRALDSVQWSMALRDAGPQVSLGAGAVIAVGQEVSTILITATCIMTLFAIGVAFVCQRQMQRSAIITHKRRPIWDMSLYGSSILGMGLTQMDLILGGAVLSGEALGIYALLRRIANLVALPVTVATWVSAAPISAAFGKGDMPALAKASADGSQIALLPGAVLFLIGLVAVPSIAWIAPVGATAAASLTFVVLLCGAIGQVFFASSFTVATLCGVAHVCVFARLCAIGVYVLIIQLIGSDLTIVSNAIAYAIGLTVAGAVLWSLVRQRLGIDTSAFALIAGKAGQWKPS